jgi:hypothetical protein
VDDPMHIPVWPDTITSLWEELAQAPRGLGAPQEDRRSRALLREELARYGLPLREEPFAAPGWTLAGEPRLTGGGTELVAQALIATAGTPAAGVEGVLRHLGPQSLWGFRPWARWGLLDPVTLTPLGYISVRQDGPAIPQALPEGAAALPHWAVGQDDGTVLQDWERAGVLVCGQLPTHLDPARQGVNLRIAPRAAPLRCLVVAHYDTVYSSGGAYDNASGTTLAVLLARDLAVRGVDGVEVILLDGEEAGLWGAQHCLRRHQEDGLLGPSTIVLNIEGIGRGSQVEFWLAPEALDSKILPIAPALEQEGFAVRLRFPPPPASDHAVFWAAGYPVVMVTIDDQDVIHLPADRPHPAVLANMRRLYPHLLRLALLLSTAP